MAVGQSKPQNQAPPKVQSVELSTGVRLQYAEQGDPSGIPVVFLHGLSDSWRSFELVLSRLPRSVRAFALTQRGHGDSSRPETGYRFPDYAADVAAFMDSLGLEAAVVVGHSMGSCNAQRFAVDHPERTLGVVLVSSFADLPNNPAAQEVGQIIANMEETDPEFVREFQQSTIAKPVPQAFFETIMHESLKVPLRVWQAATAGSLKDDALSRELDTIQAPTLIIWGDQDGFCTRSDQELQKATIPHARLTVYEGTGHACHWEEPDRLASDLTRFMETALTHGAR